MIVHRVSDGLAGTYVGVTRDDGRGDGRETGVAGDGSFPSLAGVTGVGNKMKGQTGVTGSYGKSNPLSGVGTE